MCVCVCVAKYNCKKSDQIFKNSFSFCLFLLFLKYSEAIRREDNLIPQVEVLQLYVLKTLLPEVRTPNVAFI